MKLSQEYHMFGPETRKKATLILGLTMMGIGGVFAAGWQAWYEDVLGTAVWIAICGVLGILSVIQGVDLSSHPIVRRLCLLWAGLGLLASLAYWPLLSFVPEREVFPLRDVETKVVMAGDSITYLWLITKIIMSGFEGSEEGDLDT